DVRAELPHIVRKESLGRLVRDLPIAGKDLRRVSDVGLGGGHLPSVAEAQHATQALLSQRCADLPDGRRYDGGRHLVEGVLAPRSRGPVEGILQRPGNGAVALRGDDQNGVGASAPLLQCPGFGGEVFVVVLAVQGQIPDRDLGELEIVRRQTDQRLREFAVDRCGGEAPDEVADLVRRHRCPFVRRCEPRSSGLYPNDAVSTPLLDEREKSAKRSRYRGCSTARTMRRLGPGRAGNKVGLAPTDFSRWSVEHERCTTLTTADESPAPRLPCEYRPSRR